jgi:hypothetical protein
MKFLLVTINGHCESKPIFHDPYHLFNSRTSIKTNVVAKFAHSEPFVFIMQILLISFRYFALWFVPEWQE